jgi:hypothetical protein
MNDLLEKLKAITTDAIKFWETFRIIYNIVLGLIVMGFFIYGLFSGQEIAVVETFVSLFILAVIANVLYTAAYIPDLFVQLSDFRDVWRKHRWILFLIGLILASLYTINISHSMFVPFDVENIFN